MKNFREKTITAVKLLLLLAASAYCILRTDEVKSAVASSVERCVYVLIPSLYAMLIVSGILIRSGAMERFSRFFGAVGRALFGMTSGEVSIFLLSMFAGYPVGARMLCSSRAGRRRTELLLGVCFGAGPAFIFGCISGELYGSPSAGKAILISSVSANIILAVILSFTLRKETVQAEKKAPLELSGAMVADCVTSGGRALAGICFAVMAFSVLTSALESLGTAELIGGFIARFAGVSHKDGETLFRSILDVTALSELTRGNYRLLPWISALISFGGVCVLFQISAVTSGNISLRPFLIIRLAAAAVSFFVCRSIMPIMLRSETVAASTVKVRSFRAASPIPSVMLIIMTMMLICSTNTHLKKRTHCKVGRP